MLLPDAQWDVLEQDVVLRIRMLRAMCEKLEDNKCNRKIVQDLIIPNVALLGQFCQNIRQE